jgi:uncharacterized protein YjiK
MKCGLSLRIKIKKFCVFPFLQPVRFFCLTVCPVMLCLCGSPPGTDGSAEPRERKLTGSGDFSFPYILHQPDDRYKLPGYLEEISGLAWCGKNKIACVQDEKAKIYVLDLDKDLKDHDYDFGKDGDFEDIAVDGKTAYVLRNDGTIYRIKDFTDKDRKVKKYKTSLSEKNDTEGMAFDPLSNSLLIACKESASVEKDVELRGYRAIYRFDLEDKKLEAEPLFLIDLNSLNSYRDQGAFREFSARLAKKLGLIESEISFKPSGISIHPVYGEIYMISSVGKLLIVMDRRGKILAMQDLDPELFRQPEGICFSPSGDMFISNEGQGGKGYILKFKSQDNE